MELIERYLQVIARALPEKQRADILSELRSSLYDTLEERNPDVSETDAAIALMKEMGPPQKVAASYYPAGQYLIGPALYPVFQTVVKIVFTVVVVVQIIGLVLSLTLAGGFAVLDEIGGMVNSLSAALGSVVLIFWILQRAEVQPDAEKAFDPRKLPALEKEFEPVSQGEQAFSILFNVGVLVVLARFAQAGGFTWTDGSGLFENPVITQYFPWIVLSALIEIVLDVILLWRGRWEVSTRIATILSHTFSLGILSVLIQGHTALLTATGVPGVLESFTEISRVVAERQLVGMIFFRMGLVGALVVILIDTITQFYRLFRPRLLSGPVPSAGLMSVHR